MVIVRIHLFINISKRAVRYFPGTNPDSERSTVNIFLLGLPCEFKF